MFAQSTPMMSGSFASCVSSYNNEAGTEHGRHPLEGSEQTRSDSEKLFKFPLLPNKDSYNSTSLAGSRPLQRRNSSHSGLSYSTGSSPTTTSSSTFDSPLIADMPGSPSSSPESATSTAPPKSFRSPPRTFEIHSQMQDAFPLYQPLASPPSGDDSKRNVKNLTLDMKLPNMLRPTTASSIDGTSHPFSAPTSPLKEQLKTGRRKPTNLTIRTPGFNQVSFPNKFGDVPPTPSHKPMLLHQPLSSPSLPTLASPTMASPPGIHLTLPNIAQHFHRDSTSSTSGSLFSIGSSLPNLREDDYEPPKSQEAPERGYTNGPVKIYDAGVWLYLEPTAEEASHFDTVINCAKEIRDPFEKEGKSGTVMSVWRNHNNVPKDTAEPQTAISEISFKSAFEWPVAMDASTMTPTTPKAGSDGPLKRPEYLHVPWDHNSEILEDLYPLCQIIDDRVQKGRKVLIHCQLGVSRSASLIIAYGLYKGHESNFHSMYMAVKQRSQWVGPNMSLIYQLTDFRTKVARGDYATQAKSANPAWFIYSPDQAKTPVAACANRSMRSRESLRRKEASAIVPPSPDKPPLRLNKQLPPVPALPKRGLNPDPSMPPPRRLSYQPASDQRSVSSPLESSSTVKRSSSRAFALRPRSHITSQLFIPPHRPNRLHLSGIQPPTSMMDLAQQDVPESPSLFSPRATEFVAAPFGVTTAGDLVTSAPKRIRPPPGAFPGGKEWRQSLRQSMDLSQDIAKLLCNDPRSPHQAGEVKEIIRNIDGVL